MSFSSTLRRPKDTSTGATSAGAAKITSVKSTKTTRSTTPVSDRIITRDTDSFNTGKENGDGFRSSSRSRTTAKPQKPLVPPIVKESGEARARWSTSCASVRPRGRSASPCEVSRVASGEVRKTRVSRVSSDRNERSVSVGRARVKSTDGKSSLVKKSKICDETKTKNVKSEKVETTDSVMKVSESVKLFEKFKTKASNGGEKEENGVRSSFSGSSGKLSRGSGSSDGKKDKGASEGSLSGGSSVKYPSKLHGKLAFLEEKVKRIASDIKRTKEMLDLNNPNASKVMLSDIQETVAGIEKAMGDVVSVEKEKKGVVKVNGSDEIQISIAKKSSPVKESSEGKNLAKGLNNDELEARFFPHHKLLRDRTTLKAPLGSNEALKTKVAVAIAETKQELYISGSSSNGESKVMIGGGLEMCEVQETDSTVSSKGRESLNSYNGKGNVDAMLTADEALEEFDDEENKTVMVYEVEFDDSCNDQLHEIGHKTSTGGWFVSEGESVLLAHDDGSCTFYDVANSEEKSTYKAPAGISSNLWRDCWILRAPGADGCSARYVVAASAGNSMDSGFCSWDFYTKEIKSFHIEDGITNTRTALAPLPNNVLNRRHDLTNLTSENRQWWYKPCGPLIISTASNQKVVKVYDIRDGEHVMRWELQNNVLAMDNSSPLQWRNRGKVVLAEAENVSLWDVGSLTPEPLLSISSSGKKISALHVNNTDAELGGGVRQRVSSSEAEGNDGVFCTSDSINVLDFRHPSGIGLKIPKYGTTVNSVFSRGDSIYLGCGGSPSATRKPTSSSQIQQFSIRKQKLFSTYTLPESNAHSHYKAITQVWGNSDLTMGVCGLGLFVFDALKDDASRPVVSDYGSGQKVRETVGPDNLYSPSFDYMGSRALLISRDRPAFWKYLS